VKKAALREIIQTLAAIVEQLAQEETPPTPKPPPIAPTPPDAGRRLTEADMARGFIPHGYQYDPDDGGYWRRIQG
jgi:hypothetical protein